MGRLKSKIRNLRTRRRERRLTDPTVDGNHSNARTDHAQYREKGHSERVKKETTEDSWKLVDYPVSMSGSDTDASEVYVEEAYVTLKRNKSTGRPTNTMPLEHTKYSIDTTEVNVERSIRDEDWGATFVENVARVGCTTVRSLLVSDLSDDGIMEQAGVKCGDVIIKLNGEDMARWTHEEMLEELDLHDTLTLTLITNTHQQTKYLLFLDLSPGDITNVWALYNLVSLHICETKLRNGIVDLRGVTCRGILQELAVTKSELDCVSGIKGLGKFTKLRRLNLNHNRLCSLDEDVMGELKWLEELRLGNNNLDRFPLVLTDMSLLRDLSLVYNLISVIPEQIIKMKSLENLHLDNNYLSDMPDFVTQQLPSLASLTFSNNQLAWEEDNIKECFHLNLIDFTENGVRARTGLDNFGVIGRATLRRRKGKNKEPSLLRLALSA